MRRRNDRGTTSTADGTVVLGISFGFHDAAAAVLVDGEVVAAAEEERFSRIKHDASLPVQATAACLRLACVDADDVDHVVFYEKPLAAAARFLATKQRQGPRSAGSFFRDAPDVLGRHLLTGYQVARMLSDLGARRPPQVQFVEHHLSHAASAFYPSPFESAAVITVDGIGEWATASVGAGRNHRLSLTEELRFPDSIGLAYSLVTTWCGFRSNDDEYKVMGLAPYGEPKYLDALSELVEPLRDGSVHVQARRVGWFSPGRRARGRIARRLDGPPRRPGEEIGQREADLAASIQALTERAVMEMATRAHERTGESRLCLAGGVALNCVANGKLLREGPFEEVWVQPAAGDSGGALGAALAFWHLGLDQPRSVTSGRDGMQGAFLGPDLDATSIDDALDLYQLSSRRLARDDLLDLVVERLDGGDIVAWCDGPMEFGPRALGHRSLLADPRSPTVRRRLNAVTKGREEFRPFAPAVLEERCSDWFELDQPSPYMLMVAPVRSEHLVAVSDEPTSLDERAAVTRSTIPACTHVDGSARIQTVAAATNPDLHGLLERFERRSGCPVLVNTSFNRAGEPIVGSAAGAIASAAAGKVDLLVLGDHVVDGEDLRDVEPVEVALAPGRRSVGSVERLGLAWAAAAVPLTKQLVDLDILDHVGLLGNWLFALAVLVVLARRTALSVVATLATFAAVVVLPVYGEHRFIPLQIVAAVLAGVATGWLPLRRRIDGTTGWVARSSVLLAVPVVAADLVLFLRPGLKVPTAVLLAGASVLAIAALAPGPWAAVERATAGPTRLVGALLGAVARVVERVLGIVARVISAVVTALVFVLVVLLPWALQRLTFGDPLWAPRSGGSRWIEREVRPTLGSRDLWFLDPGSRRRIAAHRLRRFGAIGAIALLVAGVVVMANRPSDTSPTAATGVVTPPPPTTEDPSSVDARLHAMRWYPEWEAAYKSLWARGTMSQYAGTEFGDVHDRYLTWTDGVRRSWEPDPAPCRPTVDIWMMGGSAAFGTGQRDDHTIASELARMAWSDGYRLRIQNRAIPGDVAWIEQRRLELAMLQGATAPDFVLFYDGFNDVRAPTWAYMAGFEIKGRLLSVTDRDLVPILGHLVEEDRGGKRVVVAPAVDVDARPIETPEQVAVVADAAAFQYSAADTLSKQYLSHWNIPSERFFQPNVNTRTPSRRGDFSGWPEGRLLMAAMSDHLPPGTIDLSKVFDSDPEPYFSDDVHTIEAANIPLARTMWASLRPQIAGIARPGGTSCS